MSAPPFLFMPYFGGRKAGKLQPVFVKDVGQVHDGWLVQQNIVREDGRVATRNYIGILSTVNCSATVARAIRIVLF